MQKVSELEIYKTAYVLIREVYKIQNKMSKTLRYSLGVAMVNSCIQIIQKIIVASRMSDKRKILEELNTEIEVLWTYLRLAYDLNGASQGEFKVLSERLDHLSAQALGWVKWAKQKS